MPRRVVETTAASFDQELLKVVVIYPEGVKKQDIRKENPFCKQHSVIYKKAAGAYEFKGLGN